MGRFAPILSRCACGVFLLMKPPAFQFYPADFIMGTMAMTPEQVGAYIRLLCYQWENGPIPNDDELLARITGCGGNAIACAKAKFELCDGKLANARLEHTRANQASYRKKQAENAAKRWVGNAVAMPSQMPNASSLSLSPSSIVNTSKPAKPVRARARDELFDALAIAEGSNPLELTEAHAKRIAVALAQIRKACPSLTVAEIQRRARIYMSVMPSGTRCTASALAANWAKCSGDVIGFAKAKSVLRPPPKDWRIRLEREYPGNAVNLENRPWASLDDEIRAKVFPESGHDVEIQPTPLQLTQ